jgi:hypothetical protein
MADFINTIDVVGDEALVDSLIEKSITEFKDKNITFVGHYAFNGCEKLKTVWLPAVTYLDWGAFQACNSLVDVYMPALERTYGMPFFNSDALAKVDFPALTSLGESAFQYCDKIATVILRANVVCSLANTNAFSNTPISKGTGYIYVPEALQEQYAQSTTWSVYAAQFRALEDYTVDGTIWGDLDENKI